MASNSPIRLSRVARLQGFCFSLLPMFAQAQVAPDADVASGQVPASAGPSLPPPEKREILACSLPFDSIAGVHETILWPNGVVPYEFDAATVTPARKVLALAAMAEIESVANVNFVPRQGEANYIFIEYAYVNRADLGMIGGKQSLKIFNWDEHYIIVHELMHSLGVYHEHQRPDRDNYVTIEWDNIEDVEERNFAIAGEANCSEGEVFGAYDFDSVMHYDACTHTTCNLFCDIDDCRTITVRPAYYAQWQDAIGQRDHLSIGDRNLLAHLYPTPGVGTWIKRLADKLPVSDPQPGQIFGWSVAIHDNYAIIGAPAFDPLSDIDAAYLFKTPTIGIGEQLFKLTASDLQEGARFGNSVGISSGRAIVGAMPHGWFGYGPGAAYLFDTRDGQQLFKLTSPNPDTTALFGHTVAIDGERAIVGAPWGGSDDSFPLDDWGAAYVFDPGSGQQLSKLLPSDTAGRFALFGYFVDISANTALVGSPFDDHAGYASGSAYLFNADTGQQLLKLIASDAHAYQSVGNSVAILDNVAVVGAAGDNHAGSNSGAAYIFDVTTGQQLFRLTASDARAGQQFGRSVAISGNTVLIGTSGHSPDPGAVYLFDVSTGSELFKLEVCNASGGDGIGTSVAISSHAAIFGAPYNDDAGSKAGAAFVFKYPRWAFGDSVIPGDANGDGIVDLRDVAHFCTCFTGAGGGPLSLDCAAADFNKNDDVALDDFHVLHVFLVGP